MNAAVLGADAGWIDHEAMRQRGLEAVDARGRRIDRVRAAKEEGSGLRVRILATVDGGALAVLQRSGPLAKVEAAVEFEGFVNGGRFRFQRD